MMLAAAVIGARHRCRDMGGTRRHAENRILSNFRHNEATHKMRSRVLGAGASILGIAVMAAWRDMAVVVDMAVNIVS
jgi:hypothetical protein